MKKIFVCTKCLKQIKQISEVNEIYSGKDIMVYWCNDCTEKFIKEND
jgi:DNA-directed RNA polymerase subunit RPC12/RpoP